MRKHILPILLVLLMVLLVGCSQINDLPQDTEISSSSVGEFSELKQDENLTDEPSVSTTESTASLTENEVVTELPKAEKMRTKSLLLLRRVNQRKNLKSHRKQAKPSLLSHRLKRLNPKRNPQKHNPLSNRKKRYPKQPSLKLPNRVQSRQSLRKLQHPNRKHKHLKQQSRPKPLTLTIGSALQRTMHRAKVLF